MSDITTYLNDNAQTLTWSNCCLYDIQRTLQQIRWQIKPMQLMP